MSNPTFIWHVTMAVHEDRVRDLQRSRKVRSRPGRRPLGLVWRLLCCLQRAPSRSARVAS